MGLYKVLLISGLLVLLSSCANKIALTGGPKDTQAPVLLKSEPAAMETSIRPSKVSLYFDEYVQLQQTADILISPMTSVAPKYSASGKGISVVLDPTSLQDSTTYSISFANSIVDLNEKNPLAAFSHVFSTGNIIDTTSLSGHVSLSHGELGENRVVIGLYQATKNLVDSAKPFYVCHAEKEGHFAIGHIKPGSYFLMAFEDINRDFKLQLSERMGFMKDIVNIRGDLDSQNLVLSPHRGIIPTYSVVLQGKPYLVLAASKPIPKPVIYNGNGKKIKVLINATHDTLYVKTPYYSRSLVLDVPGFAPDTVRLLPQTEKTDVKSTAELSIKAVIRGPGHIGIHPTGGSLDSFELTAFHMVVNGDTIPPDSVSLTLRNTLSVYFPPNLSAKQLVFSIDSAGVFINGEALGSYSESLAINAASPLQGISFQVLASYPVNLGVALRDKTGQVVRRKYVVKANTFGFNKLPEGEYSLELYVDENENGIWDPADFLRLAQPETRYSFGPFQVLDGWEQEGNQILID